MLAVKHQNIVRLRYYYYEGSPKDEEVYLNLVLDHIVRRSRRPSQQSLTARSSPKQSTRRTVDTSKGGNSSPSS